MEILLIFCYTISKHSGPGHAARLSNNTSVGLAAVKAGFVAEGDLSAWMELLRLAPKVWAHDLVLTSAFEHPDEPERWMEWEDYSLADTRDLLKPRRVQLANYKTNDSVSLEFLIERKDLPAIWQAVETWDPAHALRCVFRAHHRNCVVLCSNNRPHGTRSPEEVARDVRVSLSTTHLILNDVNTFTDTAYLTRSSLPKMMYTSTASSSTTRLGSRCFPRRRN